MGTPRLGAGLPELCGGLRPQTGLFSEVSPLSVGRCPRRSTPPRFLKGTKEVRPRRAPPHAPRVSPVNVSAGRGAASRGLEPLTGRPLRLPPPLVPSRPSPCPFLKTPVGQVPTATAQPYRGFDASWLLELEALIRNPCDGGKPQLALSLCNLL